MKIDPKIITDILDLRRREICQKKSTDGAERMYWEGHRVAYNEIQQFVEGFKDE